MKRFSERKGLTKVRTEIQINSITNELRYRLWNVLDCYYWHGYGQDSRKISGDDRVLFTRIWHNYFKRPVDALSFIWHNDYMQVRKYFIDCPWNNVYDFIEFVANNSPIKETSEKFKATCNQILEEELSAYRFVGNQIAQITSEEEISEMEEALESPFDTVNTHLRNALRLMSDRKTPDYRNSIKESISAVEAICRTIVEDEKSTLGQALGVIEKKGKIELHPALKRAFESLYGYTSSAEGIRHALLEEKNGSSFEDAKFMMVSCSAFINYLIAKVAKTKT